VPESIVLPRLIPLLRDDPAPRVVAFALVDADDYDALAVYRWGLSTAGYAYRGEARDGRPCTVLMHRVVLGLQDGDARQGDHVNRSRLDNRRINLQITSGAENSQNCAPRGRTSAHRGVSWDKSRQRWVVWGKVSGRDKFVGRFINEDAAAAAAAAFRQAHMPYSDEGRSSQ